MRKIALTLVCGLLFVPPAPAQTADPFVAAVEAHGGPALTTVQTIVMNGQSSHGQTREPIKISAALDGRLRVDYGAPIKRTEMTTPENSFRTLNGQTFVLGAHVGAYAQLDLLSVLGVLHLANGIEKADLGSGSIGGRPTRRVKAVTGRDRFEYRRRIKDEAEVQFDTQTGLVSAISRVLYSEESLDLPYTSTTTFLDYRPVAGFALPFRIDRYVNGQLTETITLQSIELNPAFERYTFGR